jgi:3D (Asp-Asp-Asp) domain-containing protein
MTRFILSLMMMLLVLSRPLPARDAAGIFPTSNGSSKKSADLSAPIQRAADEVRSLAEAGSEAIGGRLARLTAYWSSEGDYYTRHHLSSTGISLHAGHCAVDPSVIPYGSVVQIAGLGNFLAVDTGTAVVSRRAAREAGHNRGERNALVIDLYFENRRAGENFAANGPKYASISWSKPDGDVELGLSNSIPLDNTEVPVQPRPKPEPKIAAVKPLPKNDAKVASAKPVSKHDTGDTTIALSKPILKGTTQVGYAKTMLHPKAKAAAKPVLHDYGTEHMMLAQVDAPSHRKMLYQF